MGALTTQKVPQLPPMEIGRIFFKPGSPHIFRVIGPDNLVQRFSGTREERRRVMAEWRQVAKAQRALAGAMASDTIQ